MRLWLSIKNSLWHAVVAVSLLSGFTACGLTARPTKVSSSCSIQVPISCPTANAPQYRANIQAIVQVQCGPCHLPGGTVYGSHPFDTAVAIKNQFQAMLDQIAACRMPPKLANGSTTTQDRLELEQLTTYLVCNAPDN